MPNVRRYLLLTERQIFKVRRHWVALAPPAGLFTLFWTGGWLVWLLSGDLGPLRLVATFFIVLSALWFAGAILEWWVEDFVVTDRRVILVSGLLTKKVAIMPINRVTDLTFEQSVPGRVFGYGTFIFESAGQEQALHDVDFVPNPLENYQEISKQLFGTDDDIDPAVHPVTRHTEPVPWVRTDDDGGGE